MRWFTCPICNGEGTYPGEYYEPPEYCGYCGEEGDGVVGFRMWLYYVVVLPVASFLLLPKDLR